MEKAAAAGSEDAKIRLQSPRFTKQHNCQSDSTSAMFELGLLHELGLTGGERFIDSMISQVEEARPLYEQAAAGGCVEAKERLADIGNGIGAVQCIKRMAAEG